MSRNHSTVGNNLIVLTWIIFLGLLKFESTNVPKVSRRNPVCQPAEYVRRMLCLIRSRFVLSPYYIYYATIIINLFSIALVECWYIQYFCFCSRLRERDHSKSGIPYWLHLFVRSDIAFVLSFPDCSYIIYGEPWKYLPSNDIV